MSEESTFSNPLMQNQDQSESNKKITHEYKENNVEAVPHYSAQKALMKALFNNEHRNKDKKASNLNKSLSKHEIDNKPQRKNEKNVSAYKDVTECNENAVGVSVNIKKFTSQLDDLSIKETKAKGIEVKKKIKNDKHKSPKETFVKHIPKEQIESLLKKQNSTDICYVEGYLRVKSMSAKYCYISLPNGEPDLAIIGLKNRNRAFDGDYVVACINPPEKWRDTTTGKQKTGFVICILEKVHPRKAVGYFKQFDGCPVFCPKDRRLPLIKVEMGSLQKFISESDYEKMLYLVDIVKWTKPQYAVGMINRPIGNTNDIKGESSAILVECDLDVRDYSVDAIKGFLTRDYTLLADDIKGREDWRDRCVFTIDPPAAMDVDDALSCERLENGNYEIGVHIADVTHYLEFLSPLDIEISKRTTTVYTTDKVYHMLPDKLCDVCSLTSDKDKLTFSVIWEMTEDAKIVKHHFAKTVIRSCCQMSYKHVQRLIENPEDNLSDESLNINSDFLLKDLSDRVNILHNLSTKMRKKRIENGAIQITQPKLCINFDKTTGLPTSFSTEEQNDSKKLIEEFMLIANITVAEQLHSTIPETAILRNHKEPSKKLLTDTKDTLQNFGINLDIDTSASLHASMKRYEEELETENDEITKTKMKYRMLVINNLCSRAMNRAMYKCVSDVKMKEELWHYALNVPLYTHFTSPIRRYSDCMVHRLLNSSIGNEKLSEKWTKELCMSIVRNCNIKKYNAKVAQERISELYFTYLLGLRGPIVIMGIVMNITEGFIHVVLCEVGIKIWISFSELKKFGTISHSTIKSTEESTKKLIEKSVPIDSKPIPILTISWVRSAVIQEINVFTLLCLKVEKDPDSFQLMVTLLPPNQENNK